jgi:hypothetical protein
MSGVQVQGQPLAAVYPVLQYFVYNHLPAGPLRDMSQSYAGWAVQVASKHSETYHPETDVALRKLLESKDAAVRSMLP